MLLPLGITVSIHTPTQGVTNFQMISYHFNYVSIHTPTQGVTKQTDMEALSVSFNPHTHAGCDKENIEWVEVSEVSIHTPTQGVTPGCMPLTVMEICFNPHTHAGCDYLCRLF